MDRSIKISMGTICKCQKNKEKLWSLALAACLKKENTNSVQYDFSINKLMKVAHSNFATTKSALAHAIDMGIMNVTEFKRGKRKHANLMAMNIRGKGLIAATLYIAINKTGHKVFYYKSTISDNKAHAESSTGPQSFKSVCDLIQMAAIYNVIWNHAEYVDTLQKELPDYSKLAKADAIGKGGMKRQLSDHPAEKEMPTVFNTGFSYQGIANRFASDLITRSKVRALVKKMRTAGLVITHKCNIVLDNFDPELPINESDSLRMYSTLKNNGFDWKGCDGVLHSGVRETYFGYGRLRFARIRPTALRYKTTGLVSAFNNSNRKYWKTNNNQKIEEGGENYGKNF